MSYFLLSVSNGTNLNLCIKYALAGFTNSINGLWTYSDIQKSDHVSFLYGAKVFNLYKVIKKTAFKNANDLPPWPPITFRMSGKTYYFPFRLDLEPVREFEEAMVKPEFAYVAENLLLRGGYRKTHFQADQTTLQSVSQMGGLYKQPVEKLPLARYETFSPKLTWNKSLVSSPEVFYFQEFVLQSLTRQWLSNSSNLQALFVSAGLKNLRAEDFEVLGEKALPEGHIDLLIKDRVPTGYSRKVIIEVKTGKARPQDIVQLENYINEMGSECMAGVLVAKDFSRKIQQESEAGGIKCFAYSFGPTDRMQQHSLDDLKSSFRLIDSQGGELK
jgi:hypothetical protein